MPTTTPFPPPPEYAAPPRRSGWGAYDVVRANDPGNKGVHRINCETKGASKRQHHNIA